MIDQAGDSNLKLHWSPLELQNSMATLMSPLQQIFSMLQVHGKVLEELRASVSVLETSSRSHAVQLSSLNQAVGQIKEAPSDVDETGTSTRQRLKQLEVSYKKAHCPSVLLKSNQYEQRNFITFSQKLPVSETFTSLSLFSPSVSSVNALALVSTYRPLNSPPTHPPTHPNLLRRYKSRRHGRLSRRFKTVPRTPRPSYSGRRRILRRRCVRAPTSSSSKSSRRRAT